MENSENPSYNLLIVENEDDLQKINQTKLSHLVIKNLPIEKIPDEAYKSRSLINLAIMGTKIDTIHHNITKLINLRVFKFNKNKLLKIPEELESLTSLYNNISFEDNQLENFPKELCNLTKLRFINLKGNKIKRLPKEIEKLKDNIIILNISDNPIKLTDDNMNYGLNSLQKIFKNNLITNNNTSAGLRQKLVGLILNKPYKC